jgi:hypothetical protein
VVCGVAHQQYVPSCNYESKNGRAARTIKLVKDVDMLAIRDAKTAKVLGEKTFEGGEPSGKCDETITGGNGRDETSSGDAPSATDETAFIKTFVDAK